MRRRRAMCRGTLRGGSPLRSGGPEGCSTAAARSRALRCRSTLRRRAGKARPSAAACSGKASAATAPRAGQAGSPSAAGTGPRRQRMSTEARSRALAEVAFCEEILAKGGLNILSETFRDSGGGITVWEHYPQGDVFDPASGAQWFYHCHPATEGSEHGHFHCFLRPDGREGPIHHLVAVGVDAYGRLLRLFTVNQWVVGDDWLDAEGTVALLPRFDMQMPRPSYLVNRWLTGILAAHEEEIAALVRERDAVLAAHDAGGANPREDRALEITSELKF